MGIIFQPLTNCDVRVEDQEQFLFDCYQHTPSMSTRSMSTYISTTLTKLASIDSEQEDSDPLRSLSSILITFNVELKLELRVGQTELGIITGVVTFSVK
jgi:hypothetical protein